jgi:Na+-translocating ferredoxin:NAD+ oxidoreductase RnfD subunit
MHNSRLDPRWFQIGSLGALLTYGLTVLRFDVTLPRAAAIIATALVTQYVCSKLAGLPRVEPKSAMISALSLCLLLRSNSVFWLVLAAVIAIASKFVFRWSGKHIFNPTNIAIVLLLLATDRVWVSPGQWGSGAFFGFLILCAGGLVVYRSMRSDVTLAFLVIWSAILLARAARLGDPLAIPLHRLENGALLIFAFFMISDPRTTPDSRLGRFLFAAMVAAGAWFVHFKLFRTNGLLWSLAAFSPLVPLIDRVLRGRRFEWHLTTVKEGSMPRVAASLTLVALLAAAPPAQAFCGFYVAKGDAKIFNRASQVVLVRDGDRTVLTMANDFRGDPKEFAVVIPVPTVLQRGQIRVADKALIDHLDAYSAPRLVEYHDDDPCRPPMVYAPAPMAAVQAGSMARDVRTKSLGVTIEAKYTVGEYDILILSAKESGGLVTWLTENGYTLPPGAGPVLGSYIKQNLKFFVARVNLKEQSKLGFTYLRPIQVAYESAKFMLPIRLGTVNASGPQELFIYALTRKGRVETTNYRTVRLPSDVEIPVFVRDRFPEFYKAMFTEQVRKNAMTAVFLEYAWDMNWCDPCAADPLTRDELRGLGVFWVEKGDAGAVDVFVSRLHVRYDRDHFPDDLVFQETGDRANFQGRYILRHAWEGKSTCPAATQYRAALQKRKESEAKNLATLTGWKLPDIRKRMNLAVAKPPAVEKKWWQW